ncbi:MAG: hypothetical protein KKF50_05315 [Nanoarchaeota archaeon]|nr:hypothetical protein [Nanoarchaeota archaeon]
MKKIMIIICLVVLLSCVVSNASGSVFNQSQRNLWTYNRLIFRINADREMEFNWRIGKLETNPWTGNYRRVGGIRDGVIVPLFGWRF